MMQIDPEILRSLLRYDGETGLLFWIERPRENNWNSQFAGREAFTTVTADGYRRGKIWRNAYLAHRVIYAIIHGEWPDQVDHINGNRSDNRAFNLRSVTHVENCKNRRRQSNTLSGVTGVTLNRKTGRWIASITVAGSRKHIGLFKTIPEAARARRAAENQNGFHENHGRITA